MPKDYISLISGALHRAGSALERMRRKAEQLPEERNREDLSQFIDKMWEDAKRYYDEAFAASASTRTFGTARYTTPKEFWRACDMLAAGNHWEVWGRRNGDPGTKWKQELVDNEIGDQLRVRTATLTAAYHDIKVSPNIRFINDVLDQERKATAWAANVRSMVKRMTHYGHVWVESFIDRSLDPRGNASERICDPGSVLLNPFAKSISPNDGCWYLTHLENVNDKWIDANKHLFVKSFDLSKVMQGSERARYLRSTSMMSEMKTFSATKIYDKLVTFADDDTIETIPFSKEEFAERITLLEQGENPPALQTDNHLEFIASYQTWLQEKQDLLSMQQQTGQVIEETQNEVGALSEVVGQLIEDHERLMDASPLKPGKRYKYPYGRFMVKLGQELAIDMPNPYGIPWRDLWHYAANEDVPTAHGNRLDGRSDIEILWETNKSIDVALSRFADAALLYAFPKPWFNEQDKANLEAEYDTDPTKPGFYAVHEPKFPKPEPPGEYLKLYSQQKQNAKQKLGINEVTYGSPPTSNASGDLADILLRQNMSLVSGEANTQLNDIIEDIVETRILLWRNFYTEPRLFTVNGVTKALVLSEELSSIPVELEDGRTEHVPLDRIEVTVRPYSNFPMKWENEVALVSNLVGTVKDAAGNPMVPVEMLLDIISERYPSLGRNGEYRQMSEATQVGMEVIKREQAAATQKEADIRDVANRFKQQELGELFSKSEGAANQPSTQT